MVVVIDGYIDITDITSVGLLEWLKNRFLLSTLTGLGLMSQCFTSPKYWGYNLQHILESDVQNPQNGTFTKPCPPTFIDHIEGLVLTPTGHRTVGWRRGFLHRSAANGMALAQDWRGSSPNIRTK